MGWLKSCKIIKILQTKGFEVEIGNYIVCKHKRHVIINLYENMVRMPAFSGNVHHLDVLETKRNICNLLTKNGFKINWSGVAGEVIYFE